MIVIDAREGVSGDMLLAAMLGCMDRTDMDASQKTIARACASRGIEFHLIEIDEQGERGRGITYRTRAPEEADSSHYGCYSRLAELEREMGVRGGVSRRILDLIFEAEAEAHGIPAEEVHLHEIGRTEAMVNIAGIALASERLMDKGAGEFVSTAITTGGGWIVVSHGVIRVPAPASAILLRGLKHQTADSPGERATPTGIAAVKVLMSRQTETVPEAYAMKSIGFGTKRFAGRLGRTTLFRT